MNRVYKNATHAVAVIIFRFFENQFMKKFWVKGLVLLCLVAALSCKKEHDNPQWDVDVLAPLVTSTLDISNLIADSLLQPDTAGIMHVVFDNKLYKTILDSLVDIPDTVLTTLFSIPASVSIGPGIVIYKDTTQFAFGTNGPQISFAILRNGRLVMRAVNYSTADLDFVIDIPGALLNSNPFHQTGLLDAAPAAGDSLVKIFTYDLSGYHLDLTGTTGTDYNTLSYILEVKTNATSDTLHTSFNQPIFKVEETFSDIFPEYVRGKLGQDTITENSSTPLDLFRKIQSGVLNLQDATLTCTVENGIGVDAQLKINNITSVNTRTGNSVPLAAPALVGNNINITRATETGGAVSQREELRAFRRLRRPTCPGK